MDSSRASALLVVGGQIALEQVAHRTGREFRRRGQQRGPLRRLQLAASQLAAPRTARPRGLASSLSGRHGRRVSARLRGSCFMPAIQLLDQLQARFVRPVGADVRHPIAAELGHAEVQGARPRIARLDDARVRQAEVAARWAGRRWPSSRRSEPSNCSRRSTTPPPPKVWQCPQLACR